MPHYLLQAAYTPQAWEALVRNPHNRFEAIRPAIEKLGGKAAAIAIAFAAGGALKAVKTTPSITEACPLPYINREPAALRQPTGVQCS
jgi:hypothetical protein